MFFSNTNLAKSTYCTRFYACAILLLVLMTPARAQSTLPLGAALGMRLDTSATAPTNYLAPPSGCNATVRLVFWIWAEALSFFRLLPLPGDLPPPPPHIHTRTHPSTHSPTHPPSSTPSFSPRLVGMARRRWRRRYQPAGWRRCIFQRDILPPAGYDLERPGCEWRCSRGRRRGWIGHFFGRGCACYRRCWRRRRLGLCMRWQWRAARWYGRHRLRRLEQQPRRGRLADGPRRVRRVHRVIVHAGDVGLGPQRRHWRHLLLFRQRAWRRGLG